MQVRLKIMFIWQYQNMVTTLKLSPKLVPHQSSIGVDGVSEIGYVVLWFVHNFAEGMYRNFSGNYFASWEMQEFEKFIGSTLKSKLFILSWN